MSRMPRRARYAANWRTAAFALAVPQVIAYRLGLLALAGGPLGATDRRELLRMGTEKWTAFAEAWAAMATEASRLQLALTAQAWRAWCVPCLVPPAARLRAKLWRAPLRILDQGLAPIRRRAMANARRLRRRRRRPS